jgi:hypothetical protein
MSISHSLDIQTSLTTEEIETLLLSSNLSLTNNKWSYTENSIEINNSALSGFGISITPRKANDLSRKLILKEYGFIPDVSIGFHLARHESETAGTETTAKVLAILLLQGSGDAVFFINSDYIVLKRLNNKLTVYKEISEWLIPELDKSGIKYELEKSEYATEFS